MTRGADWHPFRRMRDEFDRMFDQFFPGRSSPLQGFGQNWRWGLEVQEDERSVCVRAEAPGFEPGDFDVEVRGDQLILRASHKSETKEEDRGFHEWRQEELFRSVSLPPGIDSDKIEAKYRNGILTLTLPKTEQSQGRRIAVKS